MKTLVLFFILCSVAYSQTPPQFGLPTYPQRFIGMYYGYQQVDNTPLTALLPEGVPEFEDDFIMVAVSGFFTVDYVSLHLDLLLNPGANSENDSLDVGVESIGILLGFAYRFVHTERFSLGPRIGAGWYSAKLAAHRSADFSLEHLHQFRGESTKIDMEDWLFDVGVTAEFVLFRWDWERGEVHSPFPRARDFPGISLAVQAGYLHGFAPCPWTYNNDEINGTPIYRTSGFYVRLGLGYSITTVAPKYL